MIFKKKPNTSEIGNEAELKAQHYLIERGLRLIEKNYSSKFGEIDLIMQDDNTLVFIEVKFRRSNNFGGAAITVNQKKQHKIRLTTEYYLQQKGLYEKHASRFDVLALTDNNIEWIKGAF